MLTATHANADNPLAQMIVKVESPDLTFYVYDQLYDALSVGTSTRTTVDMRHLLTRGEWEEEFDGCGSWDELIDAIRGALEAA